MIKKEKARQRELRKRAKALAESVLALRGGGGGAGGVDAGVGSGAAPEPASSLPLGGLPPLDTRAPSVRAGASAGTTLPTIFSPVRSGRGGAPL